MDLGARVKNVLNSPEPAVASKGEVDSNTPGAYPADADTPVTETGPDTSNPAVFGSKSTHNKLHKRNDPRGWAEDTTSSGLGHKHTDSGVGLTGEHETSPTRQPGALPETETEGEYTYSAPGTTGAGPQSQTSYGQADPVLHPRTEGERDTKGDTLRDTGVIGGAVPLASHRQAEEDRQRAAQTTQSEPSTATQGLTGTTDTTTGATGLTGAAGTEDTTTGTTGEREAAKAVREPGDVAQEHPYWGDLPRGAGVYNSVTGHGSEEDQRKRQQELYKQETEGLSGQHPSTVAGLSDPSKARDTTYQTGTSTGLTEESQTQRDTLRSDDQKDSRTKETLIGAGGAATATAAAATAYKMHERDNKSEEDARETKSEERPVEEKKERRRSFGLFHRTSKEAEDDHHAKEKAKEEKVKEEKAKPVEEAKHEKKHRFGGLFHRSSVSEDKHQDTAAKDLKEQEEADKTRDDSHKGAYAATGAAGLGAGAGAAYLATRDRDEQVKERSAPGQQYQPERTATEPERGQVLGTRTEPERQYQDTTTRPAQGFDEREPKDSHKKTGAAAATAAAAGIGAGAYASRDREGKDTTTRGDDAFKSYEQQGPVSGTETRDPHVFSAARSGPSDTLRDTTTSTGTGDNLGRGVGTAAAGTSSTAPIHSSGDPPAIASHANQGEYNMLSSGTPSGVRLDDPKDTITQTQPTIPEARDEGHNKSKYAAAGLGAAGLGAAGAAAYKSRDPREEQEKKGLEKLEPAEQEQVKQYEREEAKPKTDTRSIPLVGGSTAPQKVDKVIHRCHKCGEENDISSYFSQERK